MHQNKFFDVVRFQIHKCRYQKNIEIKAIAVDSLVFLNLFDPRFSAAGTAIPDRHSNSYGAGNTAAAAATRRVLG